ncbi:hypothetical protein BDY21DRAFT_291337, partial [Lineolata rhizophorae]
MVSEVPPKRQSKWGPDEDHLIIQLRADGARWEDIARQLPGRTSIGCRLRYQNYLERRPQWTEERKNKMARLYERLKEEMWKPIAKELTMPWRSVESMHWKMGEQELASRANVGVF